MKQCYCKVLASGVINSSWTERTGIIIRDVYEPLERASFSYSRRIFINLRCMKADGLFRAERCQHATILSNVTPSWQLHSYVVELAVLAMVKQ